MDHATPFMQPFLVLEFEERERNGQGHGWYVDVGGDLERFLRGPDSTPSCENRLGDATELLRRMLDEFLVAGYPVRRVTAYRGSAGPTHLLRGGAFFERRDDLCSALDATMFPPFGA